jgi:hypothetical protein
MGTEEVELASRELIDHELNILGMAKVVWLQSKHLFDHLSPSGQQHLLVEWFVKTHETFIWQCFEDISNVMPSMIGEELFPVAPPQCPHLSLGFSSCFASSNRIQKRTGGVGR